MMSRLRETVRIELLHRWPVVAVLLPLWLIGCAGVYLWNAPYYDGNLPSFSQPWDGQITILALAAPALAAIILGATFFRVGEKDGVRFFLYHHPVSRFRFYLTRYLTSLVILFFLGSLTVWLTPYLLRASWAGILRRNADLGAVFWMIPLAWLVYFTVGAFVSPLVKSSLIAVYATVLFGAFAAFSLDTNLSLRGIPRDSLGVWLGLLLFGAGVLAWGMRLFQRRRILEYGWGRRSIPVWILGGATLALAVFLFFVDVVDLLYLLGIDVLAWG